MRQLSRVNLRPSARQFALFRRRYADKPFRPFPRLHRVTEFNGTGIGLATVQRIVARRGGRIRAEAKVEKARRFISHRDNQLMLRKSGFRFSLKGETGVAQGLVAWLLANS